MRDLDPASIKRLLREQHRLEQLIGGPREIERRTRMAVAALDALPPGTLEQARRDLAQYRPQLEAMERLGSPVGRAAASHILAHHGPGVASQTAFLKRSVRPSAYSTTGLARPMRSSVPICSPAALAPPLQFVGVGALRRSLEEWFPTFRGPVGYEIHDLIIAASDDIAFCRCLNRISGTRTTGEEMDVWVRATVCYRKFDGKWLVVHEHTSVPFYMDGSYRAALDLKP